MSEIPEDITKSARALCDRLETPATQGTVYVIADEIFRWVLRERERCAVIAASMQAPKSIGRDHGRHHMAGAQAASRAILAQRQP